MQYDIEVKMDKVWYFCGRYDNPQRALKSYETIHPNAELRAIPVFKTLYVCK